MVDVNAYLSTKYDILRQAGNSEEQLRNAQAGLIRSQTETNPGEAAAREAQGFGAGAAGQGQGQYYSALGVEQPQLAASEVGLRGGQTNEANATAAGTRAQTNFLGSGISPELLKLIQGRLGQGGLSEGTSKVDGPAPKKGAATTDTTPAMLTPGEAVLNVGAAEHLGRETIDVLNAIGNIKMGVIPDVGQGNQKTTANTDADPGKADTPPGHSGVHPGGIPGYALGTPNAQPTATFGQMAPVSTPKPIDPIAGQGGTWVSQGAGGNNSIRAAAGIPGVARGFAEGTSNVGALTTAKEPGMMGGRGTLEAGFKDDAGVSTTSYHNDTINAARGLPSSPSMGSQGVREGDTSASPKTQKGGTTGYAKGTSDVPGYSKGTSKAGGKGKAGASKVTPEMLQQIMALGKGGGGLIPPGQGAPMPMSMPQVAPQ